MNQPIEISGGHSRVRFYTDDANEWRWALYDGNNRNIANGGEGYSSRGAAVRAYFNAAAEAPVAHVEFEDEDG